MFEFFGEKSMMWIGVCVCVGIGVLWLIFFAFFWHHFPFLSLLLFHLFPLSFLLLFLNSHYIRENLKENCIFQVLKGKSINHRSSPLSLFPPKFGLFVLSPRKTEFSPTNCVIVLLCRRFDSIGKVMTNQWKIKGKCWKIREKIYENLVKNVSNLNKLLSID